jgi:hypothetical protein
MKYIEINRFIQQFNGAAPLENAPADTRGQPETCTAERVAGASAKCYFERDF